MPLLEGLIDIVTLIGEWIVPDPGRKSRKKNSTRSDMPLVEFEDLPDSARTWVFGADRSLDQGATDLLLGEVDRFLSQWHAHGSPLTAARDWKYGRFLTIAVDQSTAGASGCSIDGLFRTLKAIEPRLGASLVTSGLVFYRGKGNSIEAVDASVHRAERRRQGQPKHRVFDPTVTTLGEWRARFELEAAQSWHAGLLDDKRPA